LPVLLRPSRRAGCTEDHGNPAAATMIFYLAKGENGACGTDWQ